VCANVSSLAHRSVASLPLTRVFQDRKDNDDVKLTVQWRLVRHEPECAPVEPFKLCSNRPDTPEKFGLEVWPQPPSILDTNYRLRPEQLRSLHWMIRQENTKVPYVFFFFYRFGNTYIHLHIYIYIDTTNNLCPKRYYHILDGVPR